MAAAGPSSSLGVRGSGRWAGRTEAARCRTAGRGGDWARGGDSAGLGIPFWSSHPCMTAAARGGGGEGGRQAAVWSSGDGEDRSGAGEGGGRGG